MENKEKIRSLAENVWAYIAAFLRWGVLGLLVAASSARCLQNPLRGQRPCAALTHGFYICCPSAV